MLENTQRRVKEKYATVYVYVRVDNPQLRREQQQNALREWAAKQNAFSAALPQIDNRSKAEECEGDPRV